MGNENWFTVAVVALGVISTIVGVWAVTRKNASEVAKAQALSEVKAKDTDTDTRAAETKERSDLIEMIKESGKNSVIWLETLKVTEHKRELDYATLKAIIEDGTQETINSRTKLLGSVESILTQVKEHDTGVTHTLEEMQRDLGSMKLVINSLPNSNEDIKARLDRLLGYIERLLPKLRPTGEMPAVTSLPNGTTLEIIATPPPPTS